MDRRTLFIDVDGTLLDSAHRLRPRTVRALRAANEQGHVIVIASGRCVDGIRSIVHELGFPVFLSSLNGAYVVDDAMGVISSSPFPKEDASLAARLIAEHGLGHLYFCDGEWGSGNAADYELEAAVVKVEGLRLPLEEVIATRPVHKILAVGEQNGDDLKSFLVQARGLLPGYMIMPSSSIYIEMNTPGTSKGRAIDEVCNYLGMSTGSSIAFGDWDNDISMFDAAGWAVCMSNGSACAKAHADEIALSNDDDGLAIWVETHLIP